VQHAPVEQTQHRVLVEAEINQSVVAHQTRPTPTETLVLWWDALFCLYVGFCHADCGIGFYVEVDDRAHRHFQ
jgi:hypothetical protein